ncbi:MAG: sigma-54 dependent transcriptional regulator [Bacteroidetes bacterium]|nr:sigma-54 dependent transcriptional regulator [Bacteroidota bacterium]
MKIKILIIDDDNLVCLSLKKVLMKLGYDVDICMEAEEAIVAVKSSDPDIILLDIYLTTHSGLDLLVELQKRFMHIPVVMITGYSDVKIAVTAMKSGAFDFLLKPIDLDQLKLVLDRALENINLRHEVDKLHEIIKGDELTREFFGKSKTIQRVVASAEKLAFSPDTTILIEGESGSGKEVFAKYIHQISPRKNESFIQINCATIPKDLAESELFGHERGAFTGASQKTKMGKFELANKGTILLDEIGELSLDLQVKLLRVLEERKFYRLGGEKEISVDVRVLAATNRSLEEEIKNGNFREDLYYRLNVAKVHVPPLRERKEDIPLLIYSFLDEFSSKFGKHIKGIETETLKKLQEYHWKGNIREMRNVLERAVLLLEEDEFKEKHFQFLFENASSQPRNKDEFILQIPSSGISQGEVLKSLIQQTLSITKGNQVKAAKLLGVSRSKLRYRMEQLNIEITKSIM